MEATAMRRMLIMSALMLGSLVMITPAPAQTESGAVRQYEDYRRWLDQGHKGDYEDYLEWKRQRSQASTRQPAYTSTQAPPRDRDDDRRDGRDRDDDEWERDDDDWDDEGRLEGDRDEWDRDQRDRRRPRQPVRPIDRDRRPRLPGHETCLNHYDDAIMFDRFPCRVVRPCKECDELVTFHAISYEYDSKGLLEDIKYRDEICPRCNEKAKLKISFKD